MTPTERALVAAREALDACYAGTGSPKAFRALALIDAALLPDPKAEGAGPAPVAWMRGIVSHNGPNGPDEYDVECYAGGDPPDSDPGWIPLYRAAVTAAPTTPGGK